MSFISRVGTKYARAARNTTCDSVSIAVGTATVIAAATMLAPYAAAAFPAIVLLSENEGHGDCPKWLLIILYLVLAPGTAIGAVVGHTKRMARKSGLHMACTVAAAYIWLNVIFAGSFLLKFSPGHQLNAPAELQWTLFACSMTVPFTFAALFIHLIEGNSPEPASQHD